MDKMYLFFCILQTLAAQVSNQRFWEQHDKWTFIGIPCIRSFFWDTWSHCQEKHFWKHHCCCHCWGHKNCFKTGQWFGFFILNFLSQSSQIFSHGRNWQKIIRVLALAKSWAIVNDYKLIQKRHLALDNLTKLLFWWVLSFNNWSFADCSAFL